MNEKDSENRALPTSEHIPVHAKPPKRRRWWRWIGVIASILWSLPHIGKPHFGKHPELPKERGSSSLSKCSNSDDPFLCGNLVAPSDYTNLSDSRNASIAVAFYPAGAGKTPKDQILGSILSNPGGPGGSGLEYIARRAPSRQNKTVGEASDQHLEGKYNIVSFDPRGVGKTWPILECFNSEPEALYFDSAVAANGLPGQHGAKVMKHEIGTTIAQEQLLSDLCQDQKDADLSKFMGTAFVARDMQLLHRALGDEKLNYWGFSYGTVLGSTYADMFPDDINRVISDGVVDVENYYRGLWSDNFKDIEPEFDAFFEECVKSGPDVCKLAKLVDNDADGKALKTVVMDFANKSKHRPKALAHAFPPQVFTYFMFISGAFAGMYRPEGWPIMADSWYEAITAGDFSHVASSPGQALGSEAIMQIACSDNLIEPLEQPWDIRDYEKHIDALRKDSEHFSEFFGQIGLMCNGIWPVRAAERHRGNFTSTTSFESSLIGNDYDPVTPGRYADKSASKFGNAVSVRREGYGHCSSSQPSKCIDNIVRKYFLEGELPDINTKCTVDKPVFGAVKIDEESITLSDIFDDVVRDANRVFA